MVSVSTTPQARSVSPPHECCEAGEPASTCGRRSRGQHVAADEIPRTRPATMEFGNGEPSSHDSRRGLRRRSTVPAAVQRADADEHGNRNGCSPGSTTKLMPHRSDSRVHEAEPASHRSVFPDGSLAYASAVVGCHAQSAGLLSVALAPQQHPRPALCPARPAPIRGRSHINGRKTSVLTATRAAAVGFLGAKHGASPVCRGRQEVTAATPSTSGYVIADTRCRGQPERGRGRR